MINIRRKSIIAKTLANYTEVLKPRETSLLTFVGVCTAVIAGGGHPPTGALLFALITILLGSAGVNGLTNYLDRDVDAKMQRTKRRALPSKRIYPAERVLPLTVGLTIIGLALAWYLQTVYRLCFLAGLVGTIAAVTWRKKTTCVFPQGMVASCAPVLIGWFSLRPTLNWEILLLCGLIAFWLPLHVWSVMIANREDYINAGLTFFPMSREPKDAAKVLLVFGLVAVMAAIALYFMGHFTLLYLIVSGVLSIAVVYTSLRLVISSASRDAWRLYKLSAFPYLGLLFLTMCLDIWLL